MCSNCGAAKMVSDNPCPRCRNDHDWKKKMAWAKACKFADESNLPLPEYDRFSTDESFIYNDD